MKKLFVLLISLFLILTLSACNDDEKPQDAPEKITADKFYGTWDSHSAKIDGSIFTIEELETMGDYSLSDFRIIIKEGGKAYAYAEGEGELIDWELTDTGIKIGIRDCTLQDSLLSITNNDVTVFLSKTSSSQTIQNPETPNSSHTHSGGTATCSEKAVCSTCGKSYGSYNTSNHESSKFVYTVNSNDSTKHDKKYSCCGYVVSTSAHSGGTATTTEKAKCEFCDCEYGDLLTDAPDDDDLKSQAIAETEELLTTLRSESPEDFAYFSPAFVIDTLQNSGYSEEIATYAAYNCNVDWCAEARILAGYYIVYEEEYGSPAGWMSASDISSILEDEAFSSSVIDTVISEIDWDEQIELYVLHLMEFEDNFMDGIPNRFDLIWMLQQWCIVETDEEALDLINSFDIDWAPYADRVAKHIWDTNSGDEASNEEITSILENMSLEMTSVWKFTEEETELAVSQFDEYLSSQNYSQGLEYTLVDGGYAVSGIGTCTDTDVVIPKKYNGKTVISITKSAFINCTSLTSITIPNSVTSIDDEAFYSCSSLTNITIPNSITSIGNKVFTKCYSLTSLVIGNNVTTIGKYAFSSCIKLTNVIIGNSVTSIGENAFYDCKSLTSITVEKNNLYYKSIGGNLYNKEGTEIVQYAVGKTSTSFKIPDSVTSIGNRAFYDCDSLTNVIIPDSVTSISNSAFYDCDSLTNMIIPDSVISIGDSAFSGCFSLTSVVIPDSVTSIGLGAFQNCKNITHITIPDSVTSIGNHTFAWCDSLTSVVIGNSVTSIGFEMFFGCSSLTNVVIPDKVASIGYEAFFGCSSLADVYYTGTEEEWAKISIDSYNSHLTSATIHYNYVPEE